MMQYCFSRFLVQIVIKPGHIEAENTHHLVLGKEGFTMGPSILKKVLIRRLLRTGATFFMAGLNRGACRKQML